jgi:hypothetical protein
LRGILRAVHLDKDWLEITSDGQHIKITEVGETVDDVVGPMVNRAVVVQAIKKADGRRTLVDIQAEDPSLSRYLQIHQCIYASLPLFPSFTCPLLLNGYTSMHFFLYSNIKFHYTYSQGTKAEQSSGFLFSVHFKRSCHEIMHPELHAFEKPQPAAVLRLHYQIIK